MEDCSAASGAHVRAIRSDVADDALYELVIEAGVRGDWPTVSEFMSMGGVSMDGLDEMHSRLLAMEAPSYFFNKAVSVADAVGAIYVPRSKIDRDVYMCRIEKLPQQIRAKRKVDLTIVAEILEVDLPLFKNVSPNGLLSARRDEAAFEEFRTVLSTAVMSAEPDFNFPDEATEAVRSALMPTIREVEKATTRSAVLKRGAEGLPMNLVLGAATTGVAAAAAGGDPRAAIAAGATASARTLIDCLYRMLRRPKLDGVNLVVSALVDGRPSST